MSCDRTHLVLRTALAIGMLGLVVDPASAVSRLKRGDVPPPINLTTITDRPMSLSDVEGKPAVIVFGELYHQKTLTALGEIGQRLRLEPLSDDPIPVVLIVAQTASRQELRDRVTDPRLPAVILHDVDRKAYGDYRVTVMPSVVVLDARGRVVHAIAGYSTRLADIVTDALLLATNRLTAESFEQMLHPPAPAEADEARVRAARLTSLARQLARRKFESLALDRYNQALELAPDYAPARVGLAMLLLRERQLAGAEQEFRTALKADATLIEARLGLAYVMMLRGGAELTEADAILRRVLRDDPQEPRAHYLIGTIHEKLEEHQAAMDAFRTASEIMMSRTTSWDVRPEEPDDERQPE